MNPGDSFSTVRLLDAAANRAREGLRVLEDYVRFILDDRNLTAVCKQSRHDLTSALSLIPMSERLAARDTLSDVGTTISNRTERTRADLDAVLAANMGRLQESLRSLEEFGKLQGADFAAQIEQLRYRTYTLQRAIAKTAARQSFFPEPAVYVLVDGRPTLDAFERLTKSLIDAGVTVLQLRDKRLDDRTLLQRARHLRDWTRPSNTLMIVNDRPDLAALSHADGVHVGQEELSIKDARTIVGANVLVGVSTHSIEQARQAVLEGADYIGVGPTFPSQTKTFANFPGLELLRQVSAEIRLPAFAIGGINNTNIESVNQAGFRRVAVGNAITESGDPADALRQMLLVMKGGFQGNP